MGLRVATSAPRHWSTSEVGQRQALAYWVDTVCDQFLELDIETPLRDRFHAQLDQLDLGPASINFLEAEAQWVRRTQAKISRLQKPVFMLLQLRLGKVRFQQRGHEVHIGPGECVFIDGTEPYDLECPHLTRAVALRLPGDWLKGWIARPERYAGHHFKDEGWSSALCAALGNLDLNTCDNLALPREEIADPIATLLKLAIGREPAATSQQPALFSQLLRTLQTRFHESDLTPATVAAEHGICSRSVHYAFARAQTTFIERLMAVRLARAQEILTDAHLAELPVAEVAARCGFADPSHFARRFRRQFGLPPLQFRASMIRRH
jgi:AraC family transcriptional regulator, positive regulator of tynA and feaB